MPISCNLWDTSAQNAKSFHVLGNSKSCLRISDPLLPTLAFDLRPLPLPSMDIQDCNIICFLITQEYRPQRGGKAMKTQAAELNLYLPRPTIGSGVVVKLPNKSLASLHTWLALVKTIQMMATNSIIVSSPSTCPLWWLGSKWIKNHPAWTSAQWETHAQKRKKKCFFLMDQQ